jgi:hypothetical protein
VNLFEKLTSIVGGSLFKEVKETVMAYWPPEASPEQRAKMEIQLAEITAAKTLAMNNAIADAERSLTERIGTLEGTASDLRAVPYVGPLVLFLRGLQRPVWGYAALYGNGMWFIGTWQLNERQESAMLAINFLVLGFLFGERAVQNIAPLITQMRQARPQQTNTN